MKKGLIPEAGGIYLLHIFVRENLHLAIGRLGKLYFPRGNYFYVGSAQKGLKWRIARHLRKNKNLFWHIDYLLAKEEVEIKDVHWKEGAKKEKECEVARALCYFCEPVTGFGSSDCRCESHLFLIKEQEAVKGIIKSTFEVLITA